MLDKRKYITYTRLNIVNTSRRCTSEGGQSLLLHIMYYFMKSKQIPFVLDDVKTINKTGVFLRKVYGFKSFSLYFD